MMTTLSKVALWTAPAMIALFAAGCNDDDGGTNPPPPEVNEFDVLSTYLAENGLDLPDLFGSWLIDAATIFDGGPENYFIMDIRGKDIYGGGNGTPDFEDGHIPGAHNVALSDVVDYEAANNTDGLPVVVACYSGHNAAMAVMALRLMGVQASSLKWGMSSWNADFDIWSGNVGNASLDYAGSWTALANDPMPSGFDGPALDTGSEDGFSILEARVAATLGEGLHGAKNVDVLSSLDDYQIFNYWGLTDVQHYGHVTGCYQVTPGEFGVDDLDAVDPDAANVFYCWSGQTASMIAEWLRVLGYDAYTLLYSANGMIYDQLESHKWSAGAIGDFDYETGS
jgi:rhodanese-related sulfurtransferase